jgi:hypothetical protein
MTLSLPPILVSIPCRIGVLLMNTVPAHYRYHSGRLPIF